MVGLLGLFNSLFICFYSYPLHFIIHLRCAMYWWDTSSTPDDTLYAELLQQDSRSILFYAMPATCAVNATQYGVMPCRRVAAMQCYTKTFG
jgi:hypothetical protein